MHQIFGGFTKCFLFVLIVRCTSLNYAKSNSIQSYVISLDFEQIKKDLFHNFPPQFDEPNNKNLSAQCSNEINEIKNGLKNSSDWAMKRTFNFS